MGETLFEAFRSVWDRESGYVWKADAKWNKLDKVEISKEVEDLRNPSFLYKLPPGRYISRSVRYGYVLDIYIEIDEHGKFIRDQIGKPDK